MPNELEFRIRHESESWKVVEAMKPVMTYAIAHNQVSDYTLTCIVRNLFLQHKCEAIRWNYKASTQGHYIHKDDGIVTAPFSAQFASYPFADWEMMMVLYTSHLFLIEHGSIDSLASQFEVNQMSLEKLRDRIHNLFKYYPELEGHYLKDE